MLIIDLRKCEQLENEIRNAERHGLGNTQEVNQAKQMVNAVNTIKALVDRS